MASSFYRKKEATLFIKGTQIIKYWHLYQLKHDRSIVLSCLLSWKLWVPRSFVNFSRTGLLPIGFSSLKLPLLAGFLTIKRTLPNYENALLDCGVWMTWKLSKRQLKYLSCLLWNPKEKAEVSYFSELCYAVLAVNNIVNKWFIFLLQGTISTVPMWEKPFYDCRRKGPMEVQLTS